MNVSSGKVATLSTIRPPLRGEVWLVSLDPTIGSELQKTRPAVVISSDAVGRLPVKIVAPLTDLKANYATNPWHVYIEPDSTNGLAKPSAVDVLQLRGLDYSASFANSAMSLPQCLRTSASQSA